jgi:hypothetical protein
LTLGTVKGPVAGGNTTIKAQYDGAGEHVQGVSLHPLIPVALVELVAISWMTEKSGSFTNLWAESFVKVAVATRAKLIPA